MTITKDKLVQRVMDKMARRANKGKKKFGDYMHETKKNKLQWLKEAQEECLDMAMYLEKCIEDESNVSWEGEDIKIKELNESYGGTI